MVMKPAMVTVNAKSPGEPAGGVMLYTAPVAVAEPSSGMLTIVALEVPTCVSAGQELSPDPETLHCGTACGFTDRPAGRSTRTSCSESKFVVLMLNSVSASAGCDPAWVAYWL